MTLPPSPNPLPTTEGVTQGWQDIATAPKDGTIVNVTCGGSIYPVPANYLDEAYFEKEYGDPEYMEEGWWPAYGGLIDPPEYTITPTHWRPLDKMPPK